MKDSLIFLSTFLNMGNYDLIIPAHGILRIFPWCVIHFFRSSDRSVAVSVPLFVPWNCSAIKTIPTFCCNDYGLENMTGFNLCCVTVASVYSNLCRDNRVRLQQSLFLQFLFTIFLMDSPSASILSLSLPDLFSTKKKKNVFLSANLSSRKVLLYLPVVLTHWGMELVLELGL